MRGQNSSSLGCNCISNMIWVNIPKNWFNIYKNRLESKPFYGACGSCKGKRVVIISFPLLNALTANIKPVVALLTTLMYFAERNFDKQDSNSWQKGPWLVSTLFSQIVSKNGMQSSNAGRSGLVTKTGWSGFFSEYLVF